jgi:hypothetical protein
MQLDPVQIGLPGVIFDPAAATTQGRQLAALAGDATLRDQLVETVLTKPDAEADEVMSACQALRELGVLAASNHVTAAGIVWKGLAVAAPTRLDPGERRADASPGRGVTVAVVDTGIDRSSVEAPHGWPAGAGGA